MKTPSTRSALALQLKAALNSELPQGIVQTMHMRD